MTASIRSSSYGDSASVAVTSVSCAKPAGTAVGDTLLVFVRYNNGTGALGLPISMPGFVVVNYSTTTSSNDTNGLVVFGKEADGSEPSTLTATLTTAMYCSMVAYAWQNTTGITSSMEFNQTGYSLARRIPSTAIPDNDSVVIAAGSLYYTNPYDMAPPSPWTRIRREFNLDVWTRTHDAGTMPLVSFDSASLYEMGSSIAVVLGPTVGGPQTWVGSEGTIAIDGISGSFSVTGGPQSWVGSEGTLTFTGISGSFVDHTEYIPDFSEMIAALSVSSYTKQRLDVIEQTAVVDAEIVSGDLILRRFNNDEINVGKVTGAPGPQGPPGVVTEQYWKGIIGQAQKTNIQTGIGTTPVDIPELTVQITAETDRRYKIRASLGIGSSVSGDSVNVYITDSANTVLQTGIYAIPNNGFNPTAVLDFFDIPGAGVKTYKVRIARGTGSGSVAVSAGETRPAYLTVEDVGEGIYVPPIEPPPPPTGTATTARFFYGGTGIFHKTIAQSNLQLHPRSATIVNSLANGTNDRGLTTEGYATSVIDVDPAGDTYQVIIRNDSANYGTWGATWMVPLGFNNVTFYYPTVKVQPGIQIPSGSDHHLVIRDWVNDRAIHFWVAEVDEFNKRIFGVWGGVFPANSDGNSLHPNYTSGNGYAQTETINRTTGAGAVYGATAAGTSSYQGAVTFDDMQRGYIDHAMIFATRLSAGRTSGVPEFEYFYPATTNDGASYGPDRMECGTRIQLQMTEGAINAISHPGQKMIARALKDYGAYMIDYAGAMATFVAQRPRVGNSYEEGLFNSYGFSTGSTGEGWNPLNQIDWTTCRVLIPA